MIITFITNLNSFTNREINVTKNVNCEKKIEDKIRVPLYSKSLRQSNSHCLSPKYTDNFKNIIQVKSYYQIDAYRII